MDANNSPVIVALDSTKRGRSRPILCLRHEKQEARGYRGFSARCVKRPFKVTQGQSRSSVVAPIDAAYSDFLLARNSNLTYIFNRSWYITPSLHLSMSNLSSRWNWKRRLGIGEHALVLGCPEHWTIQM